VADLSPDLTAKTFAAGIRFEEISTLSLVDGVLTFTFQTLSNGDRVTLTLREVRGVLRVGVVMASLYNGRITGLIGK